MSVEDLGHHVEAPGNAGGLARRDLALVRQLIKNEKAAGGNKRDHYLQRGERREPRRAIGDNKWGNVITVAKG